MKKTDSLSPVASMQLLWLILFVLFRDLYRFFVQDDHQFHYVLGQMIFYFGFGSTTMNGGCPL
jgi:hypothetical protein